MIRFKLLYLSPNSPGIVPTIYALDMEGCIWLKYPGEGWARIPLPYESLDDES